MKEKILSRKNLLGALNLWIPVFTWAFVIFLFSNRPTRPTSEIHWQDFIVKKTAHIIEYAFFATLLYRALKESGMSKQKSGYWAFVISVFYGLSDEFHQSFVSGRDSRLRDVLFDTIGAGFSIYYIWNLLPKAPRRLRILARKLQIL